MDRFTLGEIMSELTQDMIKHAIDQDFNKANTTFGEIMSVKMADVLDQEKIKLAGQIYNGEDPDGSEEDGEQLDLDLSDEENAEGDGSIEDGEESGSDTDIEAEDESEEEEEIEDE